MLNALFVMEQHIGHRAYYLNLRQFIETAPSLKPTWVEITYEQHPPSLVERLPFIPQRLSGPFVGRKQALHGLRHPYDIAVFNTQVPAVLVGKYLRKKPYVLSTDITPIQYDQMATHYGHHPDGSSLIARYKHNANINTFRNAAHLLPWSNWVRTSLIQDYGVKPELITVLPPGVNTEIWHPISKTANHRVRVLFIGGDFFRKGGELLLEAFRSLSKNNVELVLVTRSKLPSEPGIHVVNDMRPNSPELIALSQTCDLFVLPTQAEAFGIAAIEASALGLPVLATAVGGLLDIVEEGKTGYLIPPGNAQVLRERLHTLIEDQNLREHMGQAARARALSHFDARKNATKMSEILQSLSVQETQKNK